jgi:hypothetical protein
MPPSPDRWKARSRTFAGIAEAMAEQWCELTVFTKRQKVLAFGSVDSIADPE